ncbi:hypothetical protein D3C87_2184540 [compost metagenome]
MLKEALSDESMATYKNNVSGDIDVHQFRFSAADNEAANQKLSNILAKQFWDAPKDKS